ncbi:MAG TPA: hypothetical protein VKO61_00475 [Candidatus Paceibacterota bacterium]|nr:hypothetical protein [Candidatus Paceibacterota bacterium]
MKAKKILSNNPLPFFICGLAMFFIAAIKELNVIHLTNSALLILTIALPLIMVLINVKEIYKHSKNIITEFSIYIFFFISGIVGLIFGKAILFIITLAINLAKDSITLLKF